MRTWSALLLVCSLRSCIIVLHYKVISILSLQNALCPIVRNVRTGIWNVTPVKVDTGRNQLQNVKVSPLKVKVISLKVKVSLLNAEASSLNVKVSLLHYRKVSQKFYPMPIFLLT